MALPIFDKQYINGEWIASTNAGQFLDVIDASSAKPCAKTIDGSAEDMNKACMAARAAFKGWSQTPLDERKAAVKRIMDNWQSKKPQAIEWLQKELGCTKKFATEVQANTVDMHFGECLESIDQIEFAYKTAKGAHVIREPIGVVGCITPWNYPTNQIANKIAPALIVGCTVVVKPSEVTPVNAVLLAEAIHEAGLPKGVFNMVFGTGYPCGDAMSQHPEVDLISFTGSTRAGKAITQTAAGTLKVVRTELGGKSATLLLDDANFEKLIPRFMHQLMNNSGQSCNALSRMVVPKSRYEEAVQIAAKYADNTKVGRPWDETATIGPVASEAQFDKIQGMIRQGIEEGARVAAGGLGKPDGLDDGYFVKPTVFADVNNKMSIAQDEIFGPVLSMIPYDTEDEAIDIVNDTIYGLNNAVGSNDPHRAVEVAKQLRSGTVLINSVSMKLDGPFGGYKQSGNAREWGTFGIEEYLVTKQLGGFPPEQPKSKL